MDKVVEFLWNSNWIERIEYPKYFYENEEYSSKYAEIRQSFSAWKYINLFGLKDLNHELILKTHKVLMQSLVHDRYCGKYRDVNVRIGNTLGSIPMIINEEMERLIQYGKSLSKHRKDLDEKIWAFHDFFETVHPFIDGNGRMGRILLNWIRVCRGLDIEVIEYSDRLRYYTNIEGFRYLLDNGNYPQFR